MDKDGWSDDMSAAPHEKLVLLYWKRWDDEVRALTDAAIRTVLERLREPTPDMVTAGRHAFLKDIRDRRLLKWIFAEDPENHTAIGYVDCPIDLEVQQECADQSTGRSFAAMLDAAVREVG